MHSEIQRAFSAVPSKEIERIIFLIQVLKQIDCAHETSEANRGAYRATIYLKQRLEDLENNRFTLRIRKAAPTSFWDTPAMYAQMASLHAQMTSCNSNRKRELIELGYFLQGGFFAPEKIEKLKRILRSYVEKIDTESRR